MLLCRLKMRPNVVNRLAQNKAEDILPLKTAIFCFESGALQFIFCKIFDHKNSVREDVSPRNPPGSLANSSFLALSQYWFDVCIFQMQQGLSVVFETLTFTTFPKAEAASAPGRERFTVIRF